MKSSYIVKQLSGTLLFFAIIFICAGTIHFWQGWVYVGIGMAMFLLGQTVLRIDTDLLKERTGPGEGTESWDKVILGLSFLASLGMYTVAGFDSGRFQWSPDFHWSLHTTGIALTIAGQLLFLVAQKQNRFFSSTVRIQTERNHEVCDKGLYRIVRHPAYLGSMLQAAGFPLLFGSLWSCLPAGVMVVLLIVRTALEDKALHAGLKGYDTYSQKTRFRLIPYLW